MSTELAESNKHAEIMHKLEENDKKYEEFKKKIMQNLEKDNKRHAEIMHRFEERDKRHAEIMHKLEENEKRHAEIMHRFEENDKRHRKHGDFEQEIRQKFKEHDEILADLKRSTLIIEEYVTNRIPALFDAYSLNQEQHDRIDEKFDNLEKVTDTHSLKISILEENSKNHSKQLAKLIS